MKYRILFIMIRLDKGTIKLVWTYYNANEIWQLWQKHLILIFLFKNMFWENNILHNSYFMMLLLFWVLEGFCSRTAKILFMFLGGKSNIMRVITCCFLCDYFIFLKVSGPMKLSALSSFHPFRSSVFFLFSPVLVLSFCLSHCTLFARSWY